ncbi:hypothetical protein Gotur_002846 [Gossypium turneri]
MELVGPIFEVLKCLGSDPICTYIEHHRKLEERMNDLQARLGRRNARKNDVEMKIKAELGPERCVPQEAENWLGEVKTINKTKFTGALVIDDPSTAGVHFQKERLEGQTTVIADIRKHLMSDKIGMIGVCGMGGMGKTTIMKHIHNQLLKETKSKTLFEKIIWVTVSKEFNITKIQQDIANVMHIRTLPDPEEERAAVLTNELERKSHVLILDDVWKKFPLAEVGIPKPTSSNGSKLVLTSRSIEHVGHGVLKIPSLKQILDDIVGECDGLPLAIAVIAGSMKGIYDVAEWRNSLREYTGPCKKREGHRC